MTKSYGDMGGRRVIRQNEIEEVGDEGDSDMAMVANTYVRCHVNHPVLKIKEATVYGGSCYHPVADCDIYIGLDGSMADSSLRKRLPWVEGTAVHYPIQDMGVPQNAEEFRNMILWLAGECEKPVRIHIGCIGGHGRTGLLLSALVRIVLGIEDSITWVRENYCKKAVESDTQAKWLGQMFGVKFQKGYKTGGNTTAVPAATPKKPPTKMVTEADGWTTTAPNGTTKGSGPVTSTSTTTQRTLPFDNRASTQAKVTTVQRHQGRVQKDVIPDPSLGCIFGW